MNKEFEFDTLIVGGGIVGAGIFRDLSLHGIKTVLVEQNDFSSRTSQSSSKMLHGGIRYLENLDFHLVYEALHEKNLWLKIAPHLCYEERFYLPVFTDSKRPLWMIKLGLLLYDILSGFQNTKHQVKNKEDTLKSIKGLKSENLVGSGIYSDAVVDDSKMTLEMIYDALVNPDCLALNYHEFISEKNEDGFHLVTIYSKFEKKEKVFKVKNIVYALGPYTDLILNKIPHYHWKNILLPSKGSHLWISKNKLNLDHPMVITTKDDRVIFVIPQNQKILVGTTEIPINVKNISDEISKEERNYLLIELNNYFPNLNISEDDILGSYAGIRPLVRESDSLNLGKTSREHRIVQISSSLFVIAGGKYTTFRVMGQEITRNIVLKKGKSYNDQLTTLPIRKKSVVASFNNQFPSKEQIKQILDNEHVVTYADFFERRLGINREYLLKNEQIKNLNLDSPIDQNVLLELKPIC